MTCCPNCGWEVPKRRAAIRALTDDQVRAVRVDERSLREIAFEYRVSAVAIWNAKQHLTYKDVAA